VSSSAGWYPQSDGRQRYWDGQRWTENFAPGTAPVTTPPTGGEPARPSVENEHVIPVNQQPTPAPQSGGAPAVVKGSNGLAVAGFVLALLGALTSFIPIVNLGGDFLAFLGLIFGVVGLVQSGKRGAGKGLSIAAIILAVAAFAISIVVNITTVAAVDTAVKNLDTGQGTPAEVTGKIGQSVKDGSFTFVVHSVKCGLTTSGGALPSDPQGEFCAVNLTVTNHGKEAQPFSALEVQGFIASSKYEADAVASAMANPNTDTFLNSINPGNSIDAIVLIDVPAGKQLDTVELHDSLFSAGTSVSVK
jgi:Domain of unknown function (DUF4352)/Protein of unknown function (DUF2510)